MCELGHLQIVAAAEIGQMPAAALGEDQRALAVHLGRWHERENAVRQCLADEAGHILALAATLAELIYRSIAELAAIAQIASISVRPCSPRGRPSTGRLDGGGIEATARRFHALTSIRCTPCLATSCAIVNSPLSAWSATFALNSVL